jgi:hypothetical protein
MINDPVISGYDPDQVLRAYSRLSEMAPVASSRGMLAQTLLRKYLAQGEVMDPFDLDQLMTIEKNIRQGNREDANDQRPPV